MSAVPKNLRGWLRGGLAALLLSFGALALAGQDCAERPPATAQALEQGLQLGKQVRDQLEQSGASMALVARMGLNLSEYGQRYSHMGVAFRDHVLNRWQVVHLFNTCGKGDSDILTQPLESFYQTALIEYEALVVIPSYAAQGPLRTAFMNPASARRLHQKAYNLISHPFNVQYQNSNQWILETLSMGLATDPISDRAAAQRWLKAQAFEPAGVRIPNLRRSAARLFSPHVHFSDHTEDEYEKQTYLVVTVESIVKFLSRLDADSTQLVVR
jgi:hypothetical protein